MTGKELKQRRQKLSLTQSDLASRWKVPQSTISRWENETHEIQHSEILNDAMSAIEKEYESK